MGCLNLPEYAGEVREEDGGGGLFGTPKTVYHGLETLRCLGLRIWDLVPIHIKNSISLFAFKAKIKKWVPHDCPCRLCKLYVPKIGFL